jgi:hypothetical protein
MKFSKSEDQLTTFRILIFQPIFKIWISFLLICAGAVLIGGDARKVDASGETKLKKDNNMELIQTTTTGQNNIPPIDTAASIHTKTATFAMG